MGAKSFVLSKGCTWVKLYVILVHGLGYGSLQ